MQFYLNGFQPGDPDVKPEALRPERDDDVVDVLVIGNGPAGSLIAAQLAEFPNVSTRFIERRESPMMKGQADGIQCRTVEMFNAFGLAERLNREGHHITETAFWGPDAEGRGIVRTGRVLDTADGISEFGHVTINQARIQHYLVEKMGKSPTRLQPEFGVEVLGVDVPRDETEPVSVRVRQLLVDGQPATVIRARYVVGRDGARSTVRRSLGLRVVGPVCAVDVRCGQRPPESERSRWATPARPYG